jgi:IS30 family transposase
MPAHHITKEERVEIETLKGKGYSLRSIAKDLGKNVSSISRELSRNEFPGAR